MTRDPREERKRLRAAEVSPAAKDNTKVMHIRTRARCDALTRSRSWVMDLMKAARHRLERTDMTRRRGQNGTRRSTRSITSRGSVGGGELISV